MPLQQRGIYKTINNCEFGIKVKMRAQTFGCTLRRPRLHLCFIVLILTTDKLQAKSIMPRRLCGISFCIVPNLAIGP